jgi:hypothetical protein
MARVVALVPDLMFASKVDATLSAAGHQVELVQSVGDLERAGSEPDVLVADLEELDPAELADRGAPVLGFYSHVDVETRRRAEANGIDLVVPRSRMAREMPGLVDSLLRR